MIDITRVDLYPINKASMKNYNITLREPSHKHDKLLQKPGHLAHPEMAPSVCLHRTHPRRVAAPCRPAGLSRAGDRPGPAPACAATDRTARRLRLRLRLRLRRCPSHTAFVWWLSTRSTGWPHTQPYAEPTDAPVRADRDNIVTTCQGRATTGQGSGSPQVRGQGHNRSWVRVTTGRVGAESEAVMRYASSRPEMR